MLLNLGHTFAHAIEKELNFQVRHGEAVSVGLLMAIKLSVLMNKTRLKNYHLIKAHLKKLNLPTCLIDLNSKKKWNSKKYYKKYEKRQEKK